MSIPLRSSSALPAVVAYAAAAIFICASAGTNVAYAVKRASDLPNAIILSGVAVATAAMLALSFPAALRALARKQLAAALIAVFAGVISCVYCVSSAIGGLSAMRSNAFVVEKHAAGARERAEEAYAVAKSELARLAPARPLAEIEALLAAAQRAPQRSGCATIQGSLRLSCPTLDAEAGRARQRERLTAAVDRAAADLAASPPAATTNADAAAMSRYLRSIGVHADPERIADALVLLSVVLLESGGSLCIVIGVLLSGVPNTRMRQEDTQAKGENATTTVAAGSAAERSPLLAWLEAQGGKVDTSTRRLATALGRTPSGVHAELKKLVAAGSIVMATGAKGTRIEMRPH